MHELSIASSIIETVTREIQEKKLDAVQAVGLRIGELSGILPDALEFGFDALKSDTPLAQAELVIEIVPVTAVCSACKHEFKVEEFVFICPQCQSSAVETYSGQELEIAWLETESPHRKIDETEI